MAPVQLGVFVTPDAAGLEDVLAQVELADRLWNEANVA
jgi:hypothetical protein